MVEREALQQPAATDDQQAAPRGTDGDKNESKAAQWPECV
jgi:hypothetical protein